MLLPARRRLGYARSPRSDSMRQWYALLSPTHWSYVRHHTFVTQTDWGDACFDDEMTLEEYEAWSVSETAAPLMYNCYMFQSYDGRGPGFEQDIVIFQSDYVISTEGSTRGNILDVVQFGPYSHWAYPWTGQREAVPRRPWGIV